MATTEALITDIDRVIEYFNARRMDLPDGLLESIRQARVRA